MIKLIKVCPVFLAVVLLPGCAKEPADNMVNGSLASQKAPATVDRSHSKPSAPILMRSTVPDSLGTNTETDFELTFIVPEATLLTIDLSSDGPLELLAPGPQVALSEDTPGVQSMSGRLRTGADGVAYLRVSAFAEIEGERFARSFSEKIEVGVPVRNSKPQTDRPNEERIKRMQAIETH